MSEDSDYTSDINYPVQHQHNTSAHQYRSHPDHPYRLREDTSRDSRDYPNYDSFDQSFDRSFDQSFDRGLVIYFFHVHFMCVCVCVCVCGYTLYEIEYWISKKRNEKV